MIDDYLKVLFETVWYYAIGGLLAGLLFMLLLKAVKLTKASTKWQRMMTTVYWVVLPLGLMVAGFLFRANQAGYQYMDKQVERSITPFAQLAFPLYQEYLRNNEPEIKAVNKTFEGTLKGYASHIHYTPRKKTMRQRLIAFVANAMIPETVKWGLRGIVKTVHPYEDQKDKTPLQVAYDFDESLYPLTFWEKVDVAIHEEASAFIEREQRKVVLGSVALLVLVLLELGIRKFRQ